MADESHSSGKARVVITTRHGAAAAASGGASSGSAPKRVVVKTKGRGFQSNFSGEAAADRYSGRGGEFESLDTDAAGNTDAQKCTDNSATGTGTRQHSGAVSQRGGSAAGRRQAADRCVHRVSALCSIAMCVFCQLLRVGSWL